MTTFTIVYNEGLGFTESRKEYASLNELIQGEGNRVIDYARIYKGNTRIF